MFGKNSHRSLAEHFGCGRTQIAKILRDSESIMSLYQEIAKFVVFQNLKKLIKHCVNGMFLLISTLEDQSL